MAKKHQGKYSAPKHNSTSAPVPPNSKLKPEPQFSSGDIMPFILSLAYMVVHAIPNFEAYDALAPQWLFMALLDLLVVGYLLTQRKKLQIAAASVFGNLFSKLYIAFIVIAGISIIAAFNKTEFWVCYVRLLSTIIAFFNIALLLYNRIKLIGLLVQAIAYILFLDTFIALVMYLNEFTELGISEAILNIKANSGNKNIFAAGVVVKIPFAIYCIHNAGTGRRILNGIILTVAILTLLLANARASFVSLILITLFYLVFCVLENRKQKNTEQLLARLGFMLAPLLLAVLLSFVILNAAKSFQPEQSQGGYGTITERLSSINTTSSGNTIRLDLWSHAIDYTTKHPLLGAGYGNWKIQSIPYARTLTDDLFVPFHAHNDFAEMFAETGIAGGVVYLSLFFCIAFFTLKTYYSKTGQETKLISFFSFLAFIGYSVDALFNFPMERPLIQVLFALVSAINVIAYIHGRQTTGKAQKKQFAYGIHMFGLSGILLLLPSIYIMFLTHQSLVIQRLVIPDLNNEPLQLKWQEIFPKIPAIPNISASTQPLESIKGRYLSEAGKYDEAIPLLDKGNKANPTIAYSEFLKASIYYKQGKFDSAYPNAKTAFYTRPRAKSYYQTLMAVLAQRKDTVEIKKAYKEYVTYRKEIFGHDMYFRAMLQANNGGNASLLAQADSACRLFEKDPANSVLYQRKAEIQNSMKVSSPAAAPFQQQQIITKAQQYYATGVAAFTKAKAGTVPANKQDYLVAARNFVKAGELITNDYTIYENAAVAFFNIADYPKAILYFDKVIRMNVTKNGKSEYYKGVSLYNTGNKPDGCRFLKIAVEKGFPEAASVLKANCQ